MLITRKVVVLPPADQEVAAHQGSKAPSAEALQRFLALLRGDGICSGGLRLETVAPLYNFAFVTDPSF